MPVSTSTKTSRPHSRATICFSRHQLPASFDQQDQQIHRLALEPNRTAAAPQLVARHVELEVCRSETPGGWRTASWGRSPGGAYGAISPAALRQFQSQKISSFRPWASRGLPWQDDRRIGTPIRRPHRKRRHRPKEVVMKGTLIVAGCCAAALSAGCRDSTSLAAPSAIRDSPLSVPASGGPVGAPDLEQHGSALVPLGGTWRGSTAHPPASFPSSVSPSRQREKRRHLGRYTLEIAETVNFLQATATGTFTFTAANGDTVSGSFTGHAQPGPLVAIVENATVLGGTGRFAGAVGTSPSTVCSIPSIGRPRARSKARFPRSAFDLRGGRLRMALRVGDVTLVRPGAQNSYSACGVVALFGKNLDRVPPSASASPEACAHPSRARAFSAWNKTREAQFSRTPCNSRPPRASRLVRRTR